MRMKMRRIRHWYTLAAAAAVAAAAAEEAAVAAAAPLMFVTIGDVTGSGQFDSPLKQ